MTLVDYIFTGFMRHVYPNYALVDRNFVTHIGTTYGNFKFNTVTQEYFNIFDQVTNDYDFSDLQKTDIVLDVGACFGVSTLMLAKNCKHVTAVEPLFFDELKENVEFNNISNVECLPFALGDSYEAKELELNFCNKTAIVPVANFAKILNRCSKPPNVLKMDCEGGEWSIKREELTGFRIIEAEIHNFDNHNPKAFISMLESLGFSVRYEKTEQGQYMIHARR